MPDKAYGADISAVGDNRPPTIVDIDAMDTAVQAWTYRQLAAWVRQHGGRLDLLVKAAETTSDPSWTRNVLASGWDGATSANVRPLSRNLGSG